MTAQLEVTLSTGESSLVVQKLTVREGMSSLFVVDLVAGSDEPSMDLEAIVGHAASVRAALGYSASADGGVRTWTGICSFAEQLQGQSQGDGVQAISTYHVRIVPSLWLLTQRRNNRIYQHLAIPDIVDKLLSEWSITPTWKVDRGSYPKLEYKAQYDETDYAFLCRLLEEAGIAYYFAGDVDPPVLTFNDKPQGSAARSPNIPYLDDPNRAGEAELITQTRLHHEVRPGAYTLRDYDFRNPAFALIGDSPKPNAVEQQNETYEHQPGSALIEGGKGGATPFADDKGVARYDQKYAAARASRALDAQRTGKRAVEFETSAIALWPGVVFSMEHHPHSELAEALLMTELKVDHILGKKTLIQGTAVFAKDAYRPALATPKPTVKGVQSAVVVGPKGQEIYTDEFGRVRVQFPWDREGSSDDNSSCWLRVSQGWAGTGFGMINLPRLGQEVLVAFLDGDPDQPIVVGRVFNAVQQVPYKLPDNKTVSGWKTSSSPGGGGFNEIKLEDKKNLELFYVQAQRNLDKLVKNDETELTVQNHKKTVSGSQDLVVQQKKRELVQGNDHLHVKGERAQKIDASTSLTVGQDQQEKIGGKHLVEAGSEIHLKSGVTFVLEAGTQLTIKGPGGFIDINASGIDIVGTVVNINSGGSAGSGSASSPKAAEDAELAQPTDTSS